MGLKIWLFLASLCAPGHAQQARTPAPQPFVANFLAGVSLSAAQQPFFASQLLNAFDRHVAHVATLRTAPEAAAYLQAEVAGVGRDAVPVAKLAASLGRAPIADRPAAALMLANALARPDQFQELVVGLDRLRPGLGSRVNERLGAAGEAHGARYQTVAALRKISEGIRPSAGGLTYNARGEWDVLFDGGRAGR